MGGDFFDFKKYNLTELREGENYIKHENINEKVNLLLGVRLQNSIGERFIWQYQIRGFMKEVEVGYIPYPIDPEPGILVYDRTKKISNLSNSISFSMKLNNNFNAGIGGFYSVTKFRSRAKLFKNWKYGAHQGGFLVTTSYIIKKWTFEARMLRGIGDAFIRKKEAHRFMKSANSYELSVSYRIFDFTIKKGKNIKK